MESPRYFENNPNGFQVISGTLETLTDFKRLFSLRSYNMEAKAGVGFSYGELINDVGPNAFCIF